MAKTATPLNAEQYLEILNEAGYDRQYFADRIPESILEGVDNGTFKGTNWLKEMTLENAPQMGHAVNVTSGGDISTFSFGFSYTSQKPVIGLEEPEIKQMYERYTLRLNSEHNIIRNGDRNILTFGETLTAGHTSSTGLGMGTGNLYWNDVRSAWPETRCSPSMTTKPEIITSRSKASIISRSTRLHKWITCVRA